MKRANSTLFRSPLCPSIYLGNLVSNHHHVNRNQVFLAKPFPPAHFSDATFKPKYATFSVRSRHKREIDKKAVTLFLKPEFRLLHYLWSLVFWALKRKLCFVLIVWVIGRTARPCCHNLEFKWRSDEHTFRFLSRPVGNVELELLNNIEMADLIRVFVHCPRQAAEHVDGVGHYTVTFDVSVLVSSRVYSADGPNCPFNDNEAAVS